MWAPLWRLPANRLPGGRGISWKSSRIYHELGVRSRSSWRPGWLAGLRPARRNLGRRLNRFGSDSCPGEGGRPNLEEAAVRRCKLDNGRPGDLSAVLTERRFRPDLQRTRRTSLRRKGEEQKRNGEFVRSGLFPGAVDRRAQIGWLHLIARHPGDAAARRVEVEDLVRDRGRAIGNHLDQPRPNDPAFSLVAPVAPVSPIRERCRWDGQGTEGASGSSGSSAFQDLSPSNV